MVKKRGFPSINENVIVSVIRITPYSSLCKLEEYPGKEGMIHISEVSGKWVRDIRNFIKPNKTYVVKVLRVDEKKGHINLSLKRVSSRDKKRKMQSYKREQKAERLLEKIAKKQKSTLDNIYEKIGYDLQDKFGEMFEAFNAAFKSPDPLIRRGIKKKWAKIIHEVAKENIKRKKVEIKTELNLVFHTGDGVDRTKKFLKNLINKYGVDVKYISAPRYSVVLESEEPKRTQKKLEKLLTKETSKVKGGVASFKMISG